jgi:hypothetical protein
MYANFRDRNIRKICVAVATAMQKGPNTAFSVAKEVRISESCARKYIHLFVDAGYAQVLTIHKDGWTKRESHLFGWIEGKPIPDWYLPGEQTALPKPVSAKPMKKEKREYPAPLREEILNALRAHPKMPLGVAELAEILGRNEKTIKSAIWLMRPSLKHPKRKKFVYVHSYDMHIGTSGKPTPLYRIGNLRDADVPKQDRAEIAKRYAEKMGAMLRLKCQSKRGRPIDPWLAVLDMNNISQQAEQVIVPQKPETKAKKHRVYSSQPETHPWKEAARKGYQKHIEAQKERDET